jgi:hypothetical protein
MSSPPEPAHLTNHQRATLRQILRHPAGHNIEWRAVLSLLETAGSADERQAVRRTAPPARFRPLYVRNQRYTAASPGRRRYKMTQGTTARDSGGIPRHGPFALVVAGPGFEPG